MSSYEDLHSSAMKNMNVDGKCNDIGDVNGGSDNGDVKDDYVFVNDSDGASSDDHVENHENGVVNVAKLGVKGGDDVKVNGDVENDSLEDGDKVDREDDLKVNNGINVGEERRSGVSGGGLVEENGEIKSESEVVELGNGGSDSHVEGKVDVIVRVSEVEEASDPEPVVDEEKNGSVAEPVIDEGKESSDLKSDEDEEVFETGDNGNASVSGIASRSLDVDENIKDSVFDAQESADVEAQDSTAVNNVPDAPEPSEIVVQVVTAAMEVPGGELNGEEHIVPPLENGMAIQATEAERLEYQVGKSEVTENNGGVHRVEVPVTESEPAAFLLTESKPLETDVSDQPIENGLVEAHSLDGDFKASLPLDAEDKRLQLDDTTSAEQSHDCQQQNLPPADGENQKQNLIEADAKIDEHGDVDPVAAGGNRESVDLESAGCELDQAEKSEITDQISLDLSSEPEETQEFQSLPNQSEGAHNQGNLESSGMENPPISVGQSDESTIESAFRGEKNSGVFLTADMQFDTTDKSSVINELERVDRDGESEVMAEIGGTQEASSEVGGLQDQIAEQSGSFDVVEIISSEDCSSKKTLTVEDDTAMDADQNDLGGSHVRDCVSENKVVSASDESSEDAANFVRYEDNYKILDSVELPTPCDSDTLNEQSIVDDVSLDNSVISYADDTRSQTKLENSNGLGARTVNSEIDGAAKSNSIPNGSLRPKISFGSFECESPFSQNGVNLQSDVLNKSTVVSTSTSEYKLYPANGVGLSNSWANFDHSDWLNHDAACAQVVRSEQTIEVSASSVEGSEADSSDGRKMNPDLVRRSVYWLVKVPKGDVGRYGEQLRQCEIELAEKTKTRNAFQADCNKQQAYCRELKNILETTKSEVKAAQELVRAKKREVDSAHSLINLAKNGVTVEDLNNKIHNLEHILQHETHSLRDERELVREIRQLTHQRQQLSSNPQRQQEIQQARDQRVHTEEQLKVLKKELDALRESFFKADERLRAAEKKHNDESALLIDLKHKVRSTNDIRQEAYALTMTLRKQLKEKNSVFYNAKRVAYNYAAAGKKDSLERHCANQVETIMKMWNKNDEFRKEYIQCNMRHMLWKFGTLDGRQLGINEVPPSPGDVFDKRVHASAKVDSSKALLTTEIDLPIEAQDIEDKLSKKEEQKKVTPVAKKNEAIYKNSLAKVSHKIEIEEDKEEPKPTKEEEELARKAEELTREKEAARLWEKHKLEEKAKAEEALERKRRNAMKAQARAEFKSRKEAEQKEKEKEKRAKKKEKKKGRNPEITENYPSQPSEHLSESVKEPEVTEKPAIVSKRPQKASLQTKQVKTTKPILPALRNKGKRGLLHYWPYAFIVLLSIAFFFLGSFERIQTIKQHIFGLLHRH